MGLKKWCVADYDKELAKALAEECDVDPIVALIASARGYSDPTELEQFLSDEPYFSDIYSMADIMLAADIVNDHIARNQKIAVYGDYDCDGVTATALLISYLKARGADYIYYIPDRFEEGYGMNCESVRKLKAQGVDLIITVDNGISCVEEVALAKSLGMNVVVTDHHLPSDSLPEADAVVDPHRKDCPSEFKMICGAQVAYRLICVMEGKEPEELLPLFADILALGVVADIMPLTLENRSIVKYGIEKLKTAPAVGLSALINVAGLSKEDMSAGKIAFGLAPRINAAGRMGKADRAVELLVSENIMSALALANEIDGENSVRQTTEKKILEEAVLIIEENGYMYNRVIVASSSGWHHGVMGIVASRISERYGKPAILISCENGMASGSGRSIEGFSLYNAIASCRDLMVKFGGHEQAAGITIKEEDIPAFRERINEYAAKLEYVAPVLRLDCKLNPSALSLDLCYSLEQLEPFGSGNKLPLFGIYSVKLERITPIGNNKHLRLFFSKGQNAFQCLLFGVTPQDFCFCVGDLLDLAVTVEANEFRGNSSLSVQIKALRMSGTDDEALFSGIFAFDDYMSGKETDFNLITPAREEVGMVYKAICEKPVLQDRIKYLYINSLGYAKTLASLVVLQELGLITLKNGLFSAVAGAEKTSLLNSPTYKNLTERSAKQ